MTQEEKQLLLRDLSARLPYGVKVELTKYKQKCLLCGIDEEDLYLNIDSDPFSLRDFDIKPYLRPISSMTEDEKKEFDKVLKSCNNKVFACPGKERRYNFFDAEQEDFMNAHHFDYRGLIEKGLALEAPDGMYKTE